MRVRRGLLRLAALAVAGGAAWFVFLAWADRVDPLQVIPADAGGAADVRDLAGLYGKVDGTRFATAFPVSGLGRWIERSESVQALDALRDTLRDVTHLPIERRHVLDVVGRRVAVAWYGDPLAAGGDVHWVAATRLSSRAWAVARAVLLAERAGLAGLGLTREVIGGTGVVALPGGAADHAWHAFLAGRLLVTSNDRDLLARSLACLDGDAPALGSDPAWTAARSRLPDGEAFVWERGAAPGPSGTPGAGGRGPVGVVVRAGDLLEVHFFSAGTGGAPSEAGAALPGLGLLASGPVAFLSSRGLPPRHLVDALASRHRQAAAAGAPASAPPSPVPGYLVAVTAGGEESGIPRPGGLVAFTMRDAGAARAAVGALFPAGARAAPVAGTTARSTRESIPLAGEFEVWGAALGRRLVIATALDGIAALGEDETVRLPGGLPMPPWSVETLVAISGDRLLPLLRPVAPFLGGILAAQRPGLPNLARDLALLGALESATVFTGADVDGRRALLALRLRDLPERS